MGLIYLSVNESFGKNNNIEMLTANVIKNVRKVIF